jgi:hypothetical protein
MPDGSNVIELKELMLKTNLPKSLFIKEGLLKSPL